MSRSGHFAEGVIGPSEPQSLKLASAKFNSQNPRAYKANGLNQPVMLDPSNGNSKSDAARQTPSGQLPSDNGMSQSTYQQVNPSSYGMNLGI